MTKTKEKLLVIGLDGATYDVINPLIEKGKLPNIARLIANGVSGPLEAPVLPNSFASWTSFFTGVNPGKHGISYIFQRKHNSEQFSIVSSEDIQVKSFAEIMDDNGYKVGLINIPMTYPPIKLKNGFVVSGIPTPNMQVEFTSPSELKDKLFENVPNYTVEPVVTSENDQKKLDALIELKNNRLKAAKFFMSNFSWDALVVVFTGLDRIQHRFWNCMDLTPPSHYEFAKRLENCIYDYYQRLDDAVGELLALVDQDVTLFLVSDHGFEPFNKTISLESWLIKNGFLKLKKFNPYGFILRIVRLLEKANLWMLLRKILPKRVLSRQNKSKVIDSARLNKIDWCHTKAYFIPPGININLRGREQQGVVEKKDYNTIREQIIEKLHALKDPDTGEQVVNAYKCEDIFHGDYTDCSTDIAVLPKLRGYCHNIWADEQGFEKIIAPVQETKISGLTGTHSSQATVDGIFIASGGRIKNGEEINNAKMIDMAPTILQLFGIAIPKDLDGDVLSNIWKDSDLNKNDITSTDNPIEKIAVQTELYSDEEISEIRQRLENLGYL